jgi:hypothetical protein
MKNLFKLAVIAVTVGFFTSCSGDDPQPPVAETGAVVLSGTYNTDLTLDAGKNYILRGFVYVQSPAVLTIPAGTTIKGEKSSKGTLIIERGAKIMAQGTASSPIVFTSDQPAGSRNYGNWGGIVILGNSFENQAGTPVTEGGTDRPYGGTIAADNSGVLSYVRIEFPGIALAPNSEINGLTLGAVGSGTQIDHIQVSYSGDDAFEWFGGTVNAKNIIAHRTWDDDFDTDFGYSGNVQYGVALRDIWIADQSTSNGFESDNDAAASESTPLTAAVFSNMSVFGHFRNISDTAGANSLIGRGAHIRRNTSISIFNTVITGYREGIRIDNNDKTGANTQANMTAGNLVLKNITLAGNVKDLNTAGGADKTLFNTAFNTASNNSVLATIDELKLNAANFNLEAPVFIPNNDSPLLNSADFSHSKLQGTFFTTTTFRGAFGSVDWTSGWANFNPQATAY